MAMFFWLIFKEVSKNICNFIALVTYKHKFICSHQATSALLFWMIGSNNIH
ncbi:Uncharacterized protein APZ42_034509 [Daphnia magna]|uniref:Uncharacterized protein n=1 Tax=Daphnia magna TaxID=35525 RepID=A0A164K2Y8_9CRUS|nr:Uncharacterized protein APZ42_034509 [Daphnia magna]